MLVALAAALHVGENFLPLPLPVPGLKLGLANIVTLFVVYCYTLREAMTVAVLRVVIGSLLGGGILGPAFAMGLTGAGASCLAMQYVRRHGAAVFSPVGVSVIGAVVHNLTQLLVAAVLVQTPGLLYYYWPYLLLFAIPTGVATGVAGMALLRKIPLT